MSESKSGKNGERLREMERAGEKDAKRKRRVAWEVCATVGVGERVCARVGVCVRLCVYGSKGNRTRAPRSHTLDKHHSVSIPHE